MVKYQEHGESGIYGEMIQESKTLVLQDEHMCDSNSKSNMIWIGKSGRHMYYIIVSSISYIYIILKIFTNTC